MKKAIVIAFVCALTITLFVVPVSAGSGTWTESSFSFTQWLYGGTSLGNVSEFYQGEPVEPSGTYEWTFNPHNNVFFARTSGTVFSVTMGDVVVIDEVSGGFGGWLSGEDSELISWAWCLYTVDETETEIELQYPKRIVSRSGWRNVNISGGQAWHIDCRETTLTMTADYTNVRIGLLFQIEATADNIFSMNNKSCHFSFGDPNSPNSPTYTPPDDTGVDNYTDLEGDVLNSAQGGIDGASGIFNNFALDDFTTSMLGVVTIFNRMLPKMPWLQSLINTSLALGLFAFLVGMAQVAVGHFGNHEPRNWGRGVARRDAIRTKPDGIASHRPSRK